MKLLSLIFLVGIALASAVPVPSSELSLAEVEDGLLNNFFMESEDEETSSELAKQLRRSLDELLEKIRDSVDKGKELKEEYLHKLQELREQMKDLKIDMGNKARDLLKNLKDKAKDYWKKIWDRITGGDAEEKRSIQRSVIDLVDYSMNEVLKVIKDDVENGKSVDEGALEMLRNLREEFKDYTGVMDQKAIDFMEQISEKGKENYRKILEKLGIIKLSILYDEEIKRSIQHSVIDRLKEAYEKALKTIKDHVENGKSVNEGFLDKLRNIREKLKDYTGEMDQKARDFMEQISEKGKENYRKILEKLGIIKRSILYDEEIRRHVVQRSIVERLKEAYEKALKTIKDHVENGKTVNDGFLDKLRNIREKLKDYTGDLDQKARDFMEKISDKGKDSYRHILEKLGIIKRSTLYAEESDLSQRLREKFEEIVRKIKDALENGKSFREALEKLKQVREKVRELKVELGEKGKEFLRELQEKVKEYLKKIWEKYSDKRAAETSEIEDRLSDEFITDETIGDKTGKKSVKNVFEKIRDYFREMQIELRAKFSKFGHWAKEKYEKGLERGKDRVETLKKLAREFVNDAKFIGSDVAKQAKEFFREYKDDLGHIYEEVREKVHKILSRN